MTQEELADKLNVSRQAVSKWESGQTMPDIDKIIQISDLFGVSIDSILKESMEKPYVENLNESKYINNIEVKSKSINRSFILGIVLFSIGFISTLAFYIVFTVINKNNRYSGFNDFLSRDENMIIFSSCCIISLLGLLLIIKKVIVNTISKIFSAYCRQNRLVKWGVVVLFIGIIITVISCVMVLNQPGPTKETFQTINSLTGNIVQTTTKNVEIPSFNPNNIFLIVSIMVMGSGIIMLIIGTLKKSKNIVKS